MPGPTCGPSVARNVVLIAQEALHNASRHARASRVVLSLAPEARLWRLEVADDGSGLRSAARETAGSGMGLRTMRLRAEAIGATLGVESGPEEGTLVSLVFDPTAKERPKQESRAPSS